MEDTIKCLICDSFHGRADTCITLEQRLEKVLVNKRCKERIPLVLALLGKIWNKNPDLRLGQLIRNCVMRDVQLKFIEDDELVEKLIRTHLEKEKE